jgi:hypothetical protein
MNGSEPRWWWVGLFASPGGLLWLLVGVVSIVGLVLIGRWWLSRAKR